MDSISRSELARLLGDQELGEEAYFLEILSRWDSLRILDYLFTEGPSSTGEIARGINMDMREVRDTLNALADIGLIDSQGTTDQTTVWKPVVRGLHITITSDSGLGISHTTNHAHQDHDESVSSHNSADGFFSRVGKRLDSYLQRL
ncbi:winged helix-turn-helix domain-containing protein [Halomarina halobia]|uniref:Winged helix-turn-helix domain-containing protein n=1 Tax=Halomarina halobia TaxID=3033386 RepID=A0ABD6AFL2_9EURY